MTRFFAFGAIAFLLFVLAGCATPNPDVYGLDARLNGTVGKSIDYVKRYIKVQDCDSYEDSHNCPGGSLVFTATIAEHGIPVMTSRTSLGNSYVYNWVVKGNFFAPDCYLDIFADKETGLITDWNYTPANALNCHYLIGQLPARQG